MTTIGVIGTGSVGGTVGVRWAQQGYQVLFGTRDPEGEKARGLLAEAGASARAVAPAEAAAQADVVVIALPWSVVESFVAEAGGLPGKIVIDATNPLQPGLKLALGHTTSGGEQLAAWAPQAHVVKALNTTGYNNMADPDYEGVPADMYVAGDDDEARAVAIELVGALGFNAVDTGGLEMARTLEPLALLWIKLSLAHGREIAFKLLRR